MPDFKSKSLGNDFLVPAEYRAEARYVSLLSQPCGPTCKLLPVPSNSGTSPSVQFCCTRLVKLSTPLLLRGRKHLVESMFAKVQGLPCQVVAMLICCHWPLPNPSHASTTHHVRPATSGLHAARQYYQLHDKGTMERAILCASNSIVFAFTCTLLLHRQRGLSFRFCLGVPTPRSVANFPFFGFQRRTSIRE